MKHNWGKGTGILIATIGFIAIGAAWPAGPAVASEPSGPPAAVSSANAKPANTVLAQAGSAASGGTIEELKAEIAAERKRTDELAAALNKLEKKQAAQPAQAAISMPGTIKIGRGPETTPGITTGLHPADIYNNGFYVKTTDNSYSLYVNGLMQTRFTAFKPNAVSAFGSGDRYENTFDLYLGRLALSGNVFDSKTKYFFQFQTSTAGNTNTVTLLDWFGARTISPYLTIQAGRSYIPYTYEYYDNPGTYLLPDLSGAEYAFLLQRAIGVEAYGQVGDLGYGAGVYNSIPALDAGGQESVNGKLAYVGNLYYNILQPYGFAGETDPSGKPTDKPALTLWASGMYNPVDYSSGFENEASGDRTYGATSSILFRYNYLSFQGTGYYRRTKQTAGLPSYNSWGYGEQAGYYLIPARLEAAERISGIWWGQPEIPFTGGNQGTWFDGPTNFSYKKMTEYTLGLNFYLYGHNAKIQTAYSYLAGEGFSGLPSSKGFGASRVWIQAQLMF